MWRGVGRAALLIGASTLAGAVGAGSGRVAAAAQEEPAGPALAGFAEQLGFLGYDVTEDAGLLRVTHDRRLNFTLRPVSGGAMLLAYFEGREDHVDLPRLELVERLNQAATCARYYWDDEFDLVVEGWFPGEHDQQRFAVFMEAWHADGDSVFAAEGLTDLVE